MSVCQNDGVFTSDIKSLQIAVLDLYLNRTPKNYRKFSSRGLKSAKLVIKATGGGQRVKKQVDLI